MPTVWRFLLGQYLKVLALCVISFVAVLLTTRMDEIAQFASLGASLPYLLRFILFQIPYILPIAIPISALISTIILMQRLSDSSELTALRACGYSLAHVATPLLLMAALLSIANFYIISELATHSHLMKRVLKREIKALNPLILLQNEKLTRLKGIYAQADGGFKSGEQAHDLIIALYNKRSKGIDLLMASELSTIDVALFGRNVTLISGLKSKETDGQDRLVIENAATFTFPTWDLSLFMGRGAWTPKDDYLKMSLLRLRTQEYSGEITDAIEQGHSKKIISKLKKKLGGCYSEIVRRLSLAIAVFSFTLMGIAFGTNVSPRHMQKGIFWVLGLSAAYLMCFFTAKSLHTYCSASLTLYMLPHLVIIGLCCQALRRISQGREA